METKNLLTLAITLTVGIILAGSLLMPVLNDYTTTTATFYNDGVPFAEVDDGTHTIVMDSTGMTTDGEKVNGFQFLYGGSVSILYCESNVVRWSETGEVQVIGNTDKSGTRRIIGDTDTDTITLTITDGVAKFAKGTEETTLGSTVLAYPTADETAKYRQGTQHKFTDDTDLIIAGGFTNHTVGGQVALVMTGTVDDLNASYVWYYDTPATVQDIDVQTSNVCTNLNQVDKILVTMDVTTTGDDYELIYTQFLSEATGTYNDPNYLGDGNAAILSTIPIMVIVALVAMAAGALYLKRDD